MRHNFRAQLQLVCPGPIGAPCRFFLQKDTARDWIWNTDVVARALTPESACFALRNHGFRSSPHGIRREGERNRIPDTCEELGSSNNLCGKSLGSIGRGRRCARLRLSARCCASCRASAVLVYLAGDRRLVRRDCHCRSSARDASACRAGAAVSRPACGWNAPRGVPHRDVEDAPSDRLAGHSDATARDSLDRDLAVAGAWRSHFAATMVW